jgi:hypothetical protein
MDDNESRTKGMPGESGLLRHGSENRRRRFARERHIIELISLGAPLPGILNELCAVIDFQIGNVVSLISLPDEQEGQLRSVRLSALRFGLNPFSSTRILSSRTGLLGTLRIYCCDRRRPTPQELQLIERVIELAAIALQRHEDAEDSERTDRQLGRETGGSSSGRLPFVN